MDPVLAAFAAACTSQLNANSEDQGSSIASATEASAACLPFVTITYAQSADGSISRTAGSSTAISCAETMQMTHALRARNAAILVGVGTIESDNPSLTCRLVDGPNPRPVVVDPHLRIPVTCKLFTDSRCRLPIILALAQSLAMEGVADRMRQLARAGATIVGVPGCHAQHGTESGTTAAAHGADCGPRGQLDLYAAMAELKRIGIGSVMVEGGASVLNSFLQQHGARSATEGDLIHHVIITIAPMLIPGGLHIGSNHRQKEQPPTAPLLKLEAATVQWRQVGSDMVLQGSLQRSPDEHT